MGAREARGAPKALGKGLPGFDMAEMRDAQKARGAMAPMQAIFTDLPAIGQFGRLTALEGR